LSQSQQKHEKGTRGYAKIGVNREDELVPSQGVFVTALLKPQSRWPGGALPLSVNIGALLLLARPESRHRTGPDQRGPGARVGRPVRARSPAPIHPSQVPTSPPTRTRPVRPGVPTGASVGLAGRRVLALRCCDLRAVRSPQSTARRKRGRSVGRPKASPVHRFSETEYQPAPNPDGTVVTVSRAGWSRTGMDPREGNGGLLVCGFDP